MDLTGDGGEGIVDSEAGTLVEVEEDCCATPQIVGEAEREFEQMEREESVEQRAWDEEADYVAREGAAPEYMGPPLSQWASGLNPPGKMPCL